MNKTRGILFLFLLCSCGNAKHEYHDYGGYIVNSEIKKEVEKHLDAKEGIIDGKLFENDKLLPDKLGAGDKIPVTAIGSVDKDTIHISCICGSLFMAVMEFDIDLYKDQSIVNVWVSSDVKIFKLKEDDTALQAGILVPCISVKLTLSSKPEYKPGEILEGKVEYTTADYYEDANDGPIRYSEQISAYFKTEPIKKPL